MNTMPTVTEVLKRLREKGYTIDFNLTNNCLVCNSNALQIHPDEFVVDENFRFEGPSDPADETIIYAISSPGHNIKGVLVDGYGIYSDELTNNMVQALAGRANVKTEPALNEDDQEAISRLAVTRTLDAQFTFVDIPAFIQQIKHEDTWKNGDRNSITIFKTDDLRVVLIALHPGAELKTHTAPGIITVQAIEGKITFSTGGQMEELSAGNMVILQAGIPHAVMALEESVFLLTMAIKKV